MTRTLLTAIFLTLFSQTAWAETVFYCTGTNLVMVDNHKLTEYKTENFKFRVNQNTLKFGSGGYFKKKETKITRWSNEDSWTSRDKNSTIAFYRPHFTSAGVYEHSETAYLLTAKCDKF